MVSVTPVCKHEDGWRGSDESIIGHTLTVNHDYVIVDGAIVIHRDRRAKKNREPGHKWLDSKGQAWTSFTIDYWEG